MTVFRFLPLAAAALTAAVLLPACSDDEYEPGGSSPPRVLVLEEDGRAPVAGIKVVVMDPVANEPLAGPRVTDDDGLVSFPELPLGQYPVLAYGGFRHRFSGFHPDLLEVINPPQKSYRLTGPHLPDKTATAPEIGPLTYLAVSVPPDSLPRFAGRIVDAVTGLPLEAAFIGINPYLTGYQGDTGPEDDVSDGEGRFSVSQVPVGMDPDSGNLFQLQSLLVVRHGYHPTYWRYDFPNGSQNIDIADVEIALEPMGSDDTGVLQGRILQGGEPVEGAPVGLAVAAIGNKVGPGLTGWGAVTDGEGRYRIKGLPGGSYIVQPGYLVGDGAVFLFPSGFQPFPVMPGGETDAGDLSVHHEITPIQPYQGAVLGTHPDIFIWTKVPGAAEYEVRLDRAVLGRTSESMFTIPEDMVIPPGRHVWEVGAFTDQDSLAGLGQVQFQFRITEQGE